MIVGAFRFPFVMKGMIEEAQVLANRMEASLYDKRDLFKAHDELKEVKKQIKDRTAELDEMKMDPKFAEYREYLIAKNAGLGINGARDGGAK